MGILLVFAFALAVVAVPHPPLRPIQLLIPHGVSAFNISTPLGPASGLIVNGNVAQFTVKYATAQRFQPSVVSTSWISGTAPAPVCPQKADADSPLQGLEDCLYMNIFIPLNTNTLPTNLPILAWIHGGSFVVGSASDPGLNGSALAVATKSIIAVPQYRLGALGFLPPSSLSGNTNLGAKDVVNALQFLKATSGSLGGNQDITLAGQSSGAMLIRALLGSPSASSLFKNAWLHSDPMAYGFNTPSGQNNLANAFFGNLSCGAADLDCQQSASLNEVLDVQIQVYNSAPLIDITTAGSEPIRVVHDGQFIQYTLTGSSFPSTLKPIVLTTVSMEAGPAIYNSNVTPTPASGWDQCLAPSFSPQEIQEIDDSGFYTFPPNSPDIRPQLVNLGTDQIWRCPTWTFARAWAQHGGSAYTGVFDVGTVYPDSASLPFCSATNVCHEGDIEIVFGTVSHASAAQSAAVKETQARYSSFMRSSNPNNAGFPTWSKSGSGNLRALQLGKGGSAPVGACEVGFFGGEIAYLYQLFGQ